MVLCPKGCGASNETNLRVLCVNATSIHIRNRPEIAPAHAMILVSYTWCFTPRSHVYSSSQSHPTQSFPSTTPHSILSRPAHHPHLIRTTVPRGIIFRATHYPLLRCASSRDHTSPSLLVSISTSFHLCPSLSSQLMSTGSGRSPCVAAHAPTARAAAPPSSRAARSR